MEASDDNFLGEQSHSWDCSYARFLHVPPVPTNVTISAERLEPVIGATQVRVRSAVRLRNAGGTSPPVPSDESLTLSGSMGRLGVGLGLG